MEWIELGELATIRKGTRLTETDATDFKENTTRMIMIEDLRSDENIKYTLINDKNILVDEKDVVIAWDGANAGLVGYNLKGALGSTLARLTLKNNSVDPIYLGLYLQSRFQEIRDNCTGATIPHVNRNHLVKMKIPAPSIEIQKQIVEILGKARKIIDKRKEQMELLDDLIESIFYDMFGDPVRNDNDWEIKQLGKLGSLKNGMNYSRGEEGYSIKCLGVGDFKSLLEINDMSVLSEIKLTKEPSDDYLLKDGDILFVRSNGNRELVGRNIAIYPKNEPVTFSGFCIRLRITNGKVNSNYINYALHTKRLKSQLLQNIRGANIQNLNQKMLSSLNIPIPPLPLQKEFAEKVELIEKQKELMEQSLQLMEDNYNSLMQRAFKGDLFKLEVIQ